MTKDELIANIRRDRAQLEGVVDGLSDAALAAPGPDGGWSVKDHLAHIAAWERMTVAHLRDGSDHEVVAMEKAAFEAMALDELNDRIYRLHCDRTVDEVREEFATAHDTLVAYLDQMPEDRLAQPYWDDYAPERTALDKVAADTYLHYREHAEWISGLVAQAAEGT